MVVTLELCLYICMKLQILGILIIGISKLYENSTAIEAVQWRGHFLEPTSTIMDDGTRDQGQLVALSLLRLSTAIVFIYALFLGFTRYKSISLSSPSPITSVVIADVQPRRALIITLLVFAAFTYLLDELIVFFYFIFQDLPSSSAFQWRGVELADVLGYLAFSTIIIIGILKDRRGVDIWSRKRLKVGIILALLFDIGYLVLLILSVRIFQSKYSSNLHFLPLSTHFLVTGRPTSPGVPERPNEPGVDLPNFLHFLTVDFRILALLILLIVLFKPHTTYTVNQHGHATPTPSTLLLPAAAPVTHGAYGTFSDPSAAPKSAVGHQHNGATATSDQKATEGYDAERLHQHPVAEGSASASGSHEHHDHPPTATDVEVPPVALPLDPEIQDVPNPVTHDPAALNTSYAAVAAAHVDKEHKADEEATHGETAKDTSGQDEPVAGGDVADSPTAFAFPSSTQRDDSSLRGSVTFSPEAVERGDAEAVYGPGDKKRRRISSQNIKRIVRKITDIPKRKDSISSIGSAAQNTPGEGQTTPKKTRLSRDDSRMSGEGSLNYGSGAAGDDSPAASIGASGKKKNRMSLSLRRGSTSGSTGALKPAKPDAE